MEAIASWFEFFSSLWTRSDFGQWAWIFLPANSLACGVISFEAFILLHQTHHRMQRLIWGLTSFAAFTYLVGELSGNYSVVAPVETLLHWLLMLGLGLMLVRKSSWGKRIETTTSSY